MKLALGTAQFGQPYGIANQLGKVSQSEVSSILRYCEVAGVQTIDTANNYGTSEAALGLAGVSNFDVITKIQAIPTSCLDVSAWLDKQVHKSLARLKVKNLYGVLIHRPEQLFGSFGQIFLKALIELKEFGSINKIGVSIYDPVELDEILKLYNFDIVQAPFNIVDQRLFNSGWLEKLKTNNVEVHCRSCFLQGLLLMDREKVPKKFRSWDSLFDKWHTWLLENGSVTRAEACLSFVKSFQGIDKIVVGVDNQNQLEHLVASFAKDVQIESLPNLSNNDMKLINPSNWGKL